MIFSKHLLLSLLAPTLAWASPRPKQCKAFPGSPDWPSDREWSKLNKKIDGRLIKPEIPGGVCHKGQPNYNEDQCPIIAAAWRTHDFHAGDPVSVMSQNWADYTCLPDAQYSCSGHGYPSYVANVTTSKHVKAAIDFGEHPPPPHNRY